MIWYRSQVSLREIPDGASKVYLIGEKYLDQLSATHTSNTAGNGDEVSLYHGMAAEMIRLAGSGGIYLDVNVPDSVSSVGQALPELQYNYPPMQDAAIEAGIFDTGLGGGSQGPGGEKGTRQDYGASFRFGSSHAGGLNMAFCDGSVHIIPYEIDYRVHLLLADRRDGQSFDAAPYLGQ